MKTYYVRVDTGFSGAYHEFEIEADSREEAEHEAYEMAVAELSIGEVEELKDEG